MMRLTLLCPLKVHLIGGVGREWEEETEHQAQALVLVQSPASASTLLRRGTSQRPSCASARAALLDRAGFLSPLKSITTLSPSFSECSAEVLIWRGRIMGFSLFYFELISACLVTRRLVILNHPGFPTTDILYLPMLRAVPQTTCTSLNIS